MKWRAISQSFVNVDPNTYATTEMELFRGMLSWKRCTFQN